MRVSPPEALLHQKQPSLSAIGTVTALSLDGKSVTASIDGSSVTLARACNPAVGDRVLVLKHGTQWTAVAVVGGENVYTLGISHVTRMPDGADLNTYLTPGTYITQGAANSATIINSPGTGAVEAGASLIVDQSGMWSTARTTQTWRRSSTIYYEYWMRHSEDGGATWTAWVKWSSDRLTTHAQTIKGMTVNINRVNRVCHFRISGTANAATNAWTSIGAVSSVAFRPDLYVDSVVGSQSNMTSTGLGRMHMDGNGNIFFSDNLPSGATVGFTAVYIARA